MMLCKVVQHRFQHPGRLGPLRWRHLFGVTLGPRAVDGQKEGRERGLNGCTAGTLAHTASLTGPGMQAFICFQDEMCVEAVRGMGTLALHSGSPGLGKRGPGDRQWGSVGSTCLAFPALRKS